MPNDQDGPLDPVQRMHALFDQADARHTDGDYVAALAAFDMALPLFREHGSPEEIATCLTNKALCLNDYGQWKKALDDYNEAMRLFRKHGPAAALAICMTNRANSLRSLGRLQEALDSSDEALPLLQKHGSPFERAACLMNRANSLHSLGRLEEALVGHGEAEPLFREHGRPGDAGRCLMNRGICLHELKRPSEALAEYSEALALLRKHGLPTTLARCLMNRANCLGSLGRLAEALDDLDEALAVFREHGSSTDIAHCQGNRGICLAQLGLLGEALTAFDESLLLFGKHGMAMDIARYQMNRARLLIGIEEPREALAILNKAMPAYRRYAVPESLAICLMNRARCLYDLGWPKRALKDLDGAFAADDRASAALQDPAHRLLAREQTTDNYRFAVRLALELNRPDRAWGFIQRAKGRTLMDLLGARAEETALDRREQLLVQQRESKQITEDAFTVAIHHIGEQRLAQRAARLGRDARVPMALADVVAALRPGEALLDAFTIDDGGTLALFLLRQGHLPARGHWTPSWSVLHSLAGRWQNTKASLAHAAKDRLRLLTGAEPIAVSGHVALAPRQPFISFANHVDGQLLQNLVDSWEKARQRWNEAASAKAKNEAYESSINPSVMSRLDRYLIPGDHESTMTEAAAIEQQVLAELGELVLAPVLEQLDESVTTLIVSPDGLLHRLPLSAMTVPDSDGISQPLIDRLDLQLVPTATSLAILRGEHGPRVTWPAALLAAAPFATDDPGSGTRSLAPAEPAGYPAFSPRDLTRAGTPHRLLAASGPEIDAIAELLTAAGCPKSVIPTPEATRARLEADLPAAHILHLATHGGALEPGESVMDYRIFLADNTELRVRELYDGDVSLRDVFLVNLSSCSLGQVVLQGAEASGFVQAFLQAGAGVVLAPLWAVDDHATMLLMVRFYEELTTDERPPVSTAWRRACHWLRTETPYDHPVYWSGFLPSGDASLRLTA